MFDCCMDISLPNIVELKRQNHGSHDVVEYAHGIYNGYELKIKQIVRVSEPVFDYDDPFHNGGVSTIKTSCILSTRKPNLFDKVRVWYRLLFEL